MKKEFKVGDRVRVEGFGSRGEGLDFRGTVTKLGQIRKDFFHVTDPNGLEHYIHQGSVIARLKPKPKPEKREARKFWVTEGNLKQAVTEIENEKEVNWASVVFDASFEKGHDCEVLLREILPGEVVVTRESLAKWWDQICRVAGVNTAEYSTAFQDLCKAIGLPEEK